MDHPIRNFVGIALASCVLASAPSFADSYFFRAKGDVRTAAEETPTATLSLPTAFRAGSSVAGAVATSLAGASWSIVQDPATPNLDLSVSGDSVNGDAASVTSATTFTVTGKAASGTKEASASQSITVYPPLAAAGGPTGEIKGTANDPLPSQTAFELTGLIGTAKYDLREQGSQVVIGDKCAGLAFSTSTGLISGTPNAACNAELYVRVTDDFDNQSVSSPMFTLKVSPAASNVLAWGNNGYGQLGTGTSNSIERAAVSVSGVAKYTQVSAGEFHACGIVTDGTVDCWGYNGYGQLGDGTTANKNIPVKVAGISRATKLFAGPNSTCAISDGKLWCWGYGSYGLLGNGRTTNSSAPVQALISDPVSDVVGSTMNMCAMTTSGVPYCWGNNGSYQVGVPRSVDTTVPVPATELFGATKLAVSGMSTCGIFSGGAIKCLGSNWSGELGNGTTSSSQFLVNVIGASSGATKIVGSGYGFCAIVSGSAKCWGPNDWGNMGTGTKGGAVLTATEVLGMQGGVTDIDVKSKHACAVQGGAIKCWGTNDQSQLGTGNTSNMFSPVQVVGMSSGKTGVALGEAHTYAW